METGPGPGPDDLTHFRQLIEDPTRYHLFHALRVIEARYRDAPRLGESRTAAQDRVRLGQLPELAFPPATLTAFQPGKGMQPARLSNLFFGLWGPHGPLPLHLTEYARDRLRNHRDPTLVAFADMLTHRVMSLLYRVWAAAQPAPAFDRAWVALDEASHHLLAELETQQSQLDALARAVDPDLAEGPAEGLTGPDKMQGMPEAGAEQWVPDGQAAGMAQFAVSRDLEPDAPGIIRSGFDGNRAAFPDPPSQGADPSPGRTATGIGAEPQATSGPTPDEDFERTVVLPRMRPPAGGGGAQAARAATASEAAAAEDPFAPLHAPASPDEEERTVIPFPRKASAAPGPGRSPIGGAATWPEGGASDLPQAMTSSRPAPVQADPFGAGMADPFGSANLPGQETGDPLLIPCDSPLIGQPAGLPEATSDHAVVPIRGQVDQGHHPDARDAEAPGATDPANWLPELAAAPAERLVPGAQPLQAGPQPHSPQAWRHDAAGHLYRDPENSSGGSDAIPAPESDLTGAGEAGSSFNYIEISASRDQAAARPMPERAPADAALYGAAQVFEPGDTTGDRGTDGSAQMDPLHAGTDDLTGLAQFDALLEQGPAPPPDPAAAARQQASAVLAALQAMAVRLAPRPAPKGRLDLSRDALQRKVAALSGYADGSMLGADAMPDLSKRYFAGLLSSGPRHAEGLRVILEHFFEAKVTIQQFVGQWLTLEKDDTWQLGKTGLGRGTSVGRKVWSRDSKFRLQIGPLDLADYQRLLPGRGAIERMEAIVRNYTGDRLAWDVQLILKSDQVPEAVLGKSAGLGYNCWIGTRKTALEDANDLILTPPSQTKAARALAGH